MTEAAAAPEPAPTGPEADVGVADPASTLRVAALLTLKRRKPVDGPLQHPSPDDSSPQLDYGQDDNKQPATEVQMRTEGQHREEGEISDSEDPALKASKALATIKAESPPDGARVAPLLPVGEVYLDADHVRPGLSMNQEQYDTAKDIVLDLLGWGVPPHYLVDCNLSREIVYYVFSELNLRLPHNLDVTGLVQYTPAVVAKHSRPLSAMSSSSLIAKPVAELADSPTLHDIERQRRQELLARKAVQASRKIGKPSSDASPDASLSESYAPDQDVEMPPVIATEAVDDFLKSIGEKQSSLPEVDVKAQPVDDTMDVDDPPAQPFTVNGEGMTTDEPQPTGSPARSNAAPLAGDINHTVDEHTPPQRTSRRGAKRPTAVDFVDFDMGSRNGHPGPVPPLKRKSASFASVSGQRKLVIDLSDSEGGDDYPMQDAASVATPPSGAGNLVEKKEEEIRKMRELIAQREKSRLQKAKSTRATPAESVREEASIIDSNANDSEPRSATVTPPLLESEGSVSGNGVQGMYILRSFRLRRPLALIATLDISLPASFSACFSMCLFPGFYCFAAHHLDMANFQIRPVSRIQLWQELPNAEDKQEPAAVDVESASSSSAQVRPANPIADDDPKPPKTRRKSTRRTQI
ncbi:MADS-box domain-containing protein [Mycena chlorophos]|uniref:MADS-box domain-containing protein n=1 Tax=Mycena chlorophos TaxID=658473 RepID=A0A8H6RX74_MYCCL|nr:MADS-box domain-containing protein [Mycena chlorophos]